MGASHHQLEALQSEIRSATARAQQFADDCPAGLFTTRPGNNSWSVAEFQSHLSSRVDLSSGFDLSEIHIVSPFNEKARYSLYSAYRILLSHERRHLWQAEQVIHFVKG